MKKYLFSKTGTLLNPPHPVSNELIEQLERERGFVLPAAYIELLKIQNGGYIKKDLFICNDDQEYQMESLAGIGKDRNGGLDLLEPEEHPLLAEADMSHILPIDYFGYEFTALDYRQCGLKGIPKIISLSVLEPPLIISHITDSIDALLEGLKRGDRYYIFGLDNCPEDPTEAVARMQKCLKARLELPEPGKMPVYCFWLEPKEKKEYIDLQPNIDYATHYDGDKVSSSPAGLEFEEFPEYHWLLYCDPNLSQINQRMKKIVKSGVPLSLIHEPPPDIIAWVVPRK